MPRTGHTVPRERSEIDRRAARDEDDAYTTDQSASVAGTRRAGDQTWAASLGAAGYLIGVTGGALVITLLVVALGAGGWIVTALAVVVLLGALAALAAFLIRRTAEVEKPSAERVADLEAEGVRDPEKAVNERLDHEHQDEVTPAARGAERVGPGG